MLRAGESAENQRDAVAARSRSDAADGRVLEQNARPHESLRPPVGALSVRGRGGRWTGARGSERRSRKEGREQSEGAWAAYILSNAAGKQNTRLHVLRRRRQHHAACLHSHRPRAPLLDESLCCVVAKDGEGLVGRGSEAERRERVRAEERELEQRAEHRKVDWTSGLVGAKLLMCHQRLNIFSFSREITLLERDLFLLLFVFLSFPS